MQSIEERAILGLPIYTKFGELKPLSIQDYMERADSLSIISMDKKKILSELGKGQQEQTGQSDNEVYELLFELKENYSFFQLIKEFFGELLNHYLIITRYCKFFYLEDTKAEYINEEEFDKDLLIKSADFLMSLSDEEFEEYRKILLKLNGTSEITSTINPTLYKREDKVKKSSKKKDDDIPNLVTMVSACATYTGINYKEIAQWNSFQLQETFKRIELFIANNATTLFKSVSSEIEITAWHSNSKSEESKNKDQSLESFMQSMEGYVK